MKLNSTKEFPFSIDVAWAALHQPAKLDVEPGAEVHEISDTKWKRTVKMQEQSIHTRRRMMM